MTEITLILILLIASGFFASSEVAFFGLNKFLLEKKANKNPLTLKLVKKLLSSPIELIITILIGNELVNILISSLGTTFLKNYFTETIVVLGGFLISLSIFLFGEVIPKNIALRFPETLAQIYAIPLYIFSLLLYPIRKSLSKVLGKLLEDIEKKEEQKISEEELLYHLEENFKRGYISEDELEIIKRVLKLSDTTVEEIMTPRTDIFALEEEMKVKDAIPLILDKMHSKIPLYAENLDNIKGVLYIKDLLPVEYYQEKKLKEFKREVRFLPAILDLENLIKEFKKYRTQIFLVVDEHGGTAGLITFYDFLKWFLGEMIEEWGEERIKEIAKGVYIVDAGINIETLSEKIGLKLPEDYEYSTLGGYLISLVKEFPKQYTVIETPNFKFVILSLENNRIKSVKIVKKTS